MQSDQREKKMKRKFEDFDATKVAAVPKLRAAEVPKSFVQGTISRRNIWPNGTAAYFDLVSHGTLYNRQLTRQRYINHCFKPTYPFT